MDANGNDGEGETKSDDAEHGFCVAVKDGAGDERHDGEDATADTDHETLAVLGSVIILPLFNHAVYAVSELDRLLFEKFVVLQLPPVENELSDAADNEQ